MRVAETALHSYRSQHKAAGDKAALLLQAVKLLSLLSKCAMPNGGDVSALFEEHMRNAANRRYRLLKTELQPPALGDACIRSCMHAYVCMYACLCLLACLLVHSLFLAVSFLSWVLPLFPSQGC